MRKTRKTLIGILVGFLLFGGLSTAALAGSGNSDHNPQTTNCNSNNPNGGGCPANDPSPQPTSPVCGLGNHTGNPHCPPGTSTSTPTATSTPTTEPTATPTVAPTATPSATPTAVPTVTPVPTLVPDEPRDACYNTNPECGDITVLIDSVPVIINDPAAPDWTPLYWTYVDDTIQAQPTEASSSTVRIPLPPKSGNAGLR